MSKSTILVETKTRERLKYQGRKGQTYDDLINQLIDTLRNDIKNNQDSPDRRFEARNQGNPGAHKSVGPL
ncbi:MAG: hypothetical protein M3044_01070 [Thermoproteota archaeon]|nr:hypothetical protein [Thermoproteota archaeon]